MDDRTVNDSLAVALGDVANLVDLAERDPCAAADQLERWADELRAAAVRLRELAQGGDTVSQGGMHDRVQMRVLDSSGRERQYIDTHKGRRP